MSCQLNVFADFHDITTVRNFLFPELKSEPPDANENLGKLLTGLNLASTSRKLRKFDKAQYLHFLIIYSVTNTPVISKVFICRFYLSLLLCLQKTRGGMRTGGHGKRKKSQKIERLQN